MESESPWKEIAAQAAVDALVVSLRQIVVRDLDDAAEIRQHACARLVQRRIEADRNGETVLVESINVVLEHLTTNTP